jgi:hypothetical protein
LYWSSSRSSLPDDHGVAVRGRGLGSGRTVLPAVESILWFGLIVDGGLLASRGAFRALTLLVLR